MDNYPFKNNLKKTQISCRFYNASKTPKVLKKLDNKQKNKSCKRKSCQSCGFCNPKHKRYTAAIGPNTIEFLSKISKDKYQN